MILNIKSPAAPRRRGRRRHPSCGRAITMAQRHGRPPAGARETLTPASDTHGLADPGRGRPEASRRRRSQRRLVATPPRSRGGRSPPLHSLTTNLSRRCVRFHSRISHCVTTDASTRVASQALVAERQRHLLLGRCNVTMRDFSVTAGEASLCLLVSTWLGASMRPRSEPSERPQRETVRERP